MMASVDLGSCQRFHKIAFRECGARHGSRLNSRRSVLRAISAPEKTETKAEKGAISAATRRQLGDSDLLVSGTLLALRDTDGDG